MVTAALTAGAAAPAWAAPAWLAQPDLSATGENASPPSVAMNGAGDAVVAWQQTSGSGFVAQASLRPAGTSFSAPVPLGPAGLEEFGTPQAAIDATGNAVVAWQQPDGLSLNTVVHAALGTAGGAFGAAVLLSQAGSVSVRPQVAMNAAGDTVVVWEHVANQQVVGQAVGRPAGGTFSAPLDVSGAGLQAPRPRATIDDAGNATVVWTQTGPGGDTIQAAMRPAGGAFSAPDDLSATGQAGSADVASNGAGEAVAVWEHVDPTNTRIVQAATRPPGAAFSAPVDLSLSGRDAVDPRVALDAAGDAFAVWTRFDGATNVVQIATRLAGGVFGVPADLSLAGGEARDPRIAVSPSGDVVAAWRRANGTNTIVQAIARRAGASFGATADLSASGRDAVAPRVGIDADGDAIAAWQRSDGANTIVQAAGYDLVGPQLRGLSVPAAAAAGADATYSLSPLDVWSPVTSTVWSFDDGTTASGATVTHAFASPGDHTVIVTATDALGNTTSAARVVSVAAPPAAGGPAPPPTVEPPPPPPPPPPPAGSPRAARLSSAIGFSAHVTTRYTVFTRLVVQPALAGTTIRVRCSGRGCRLTTKTRTVTQDTRRLDLTALVRSSKLRRGAQLEVRVTKALAIGTSATIGVRDRRRPRRVTRCLYPGEARPSICPPTGSVPTIGLR